MITHNESLLLIVGGSGRMIEFGALSFKMILFTISHSVFGKENPVEILVNSREMALELSYVYIKYVYGKEKAEFQKPYIITDDNNCWKIEGKQPKTLGGNFTILIAKKDGQVLHVIHTK